MITVTQSPHSITITGHAGHAEHGKDIVCAGISTLVQTLIASIEALTDDSMEYHIESGKTELFFETDLSEGAQLLIKSFFIGVSGIETAYPGYVKLTKH